MGTCCIGLIGKISTKCQERKLIIRWCRREFLSQPLHTMLTADHFCYCDSAERKTHGLPRFKTIDSVLFNWGIYSNDMEGFQPRFGIGTLELYYGAEIKAIYIGDFIKKNACKFEVDNIMVR